MQIRRLGYALGAEVTGVDLRRPLDPATVAAIRRAWLENIVLCFPGQPLEPEQLEAFSSYFGEVDDNRRSPYLRHPDYERVIVLANKPVVVKDKKFGGSVADKWHTDFSFSNRPTTGSFLNAQEIPDVGGDTMFANMYAAYETLSPAMQRLLEALEAFHDIRLGAAFSKEDPAVQAERVRMNPAVAHRVVQVHPETKRKSLYIGCRIRYFVGMTEEESRPLLDFLNEHAVRYEFMYRHRWTNHDLVMWDNRCALHYAVPDYDRSQARRMIRCSLIGPKTGRAGDEAGRPELATV